jgi:hypothetical protein
MLMFSGDVFYENTLSIPAAMLLSIHQQLDATGAAAILN